MLGLFAENGPLRVSRNGTGPDDFVVTWQDPATTGGSWFDEADILYIDQPVNTGFSYGESLLSTMDQAGDQFVTFLENFLIEYPDYSRLYRTVTLAGQSYAGKYIPFFAGKILDKMSPLISLENLLIGNPYTSPVNQRKDTYKVG
jgi:carboxypeptidase C (cathepsin A)